MERAVNPTTQITLARKTLLGAALLYFAMSAPYVFAQAETNPIAALTPVSNAELAAPEDSDWLSWRRTYDAQGFSPLDQINRTNVADLQIAWKNELQVGPNMATPLVHEGVMYLLSAADTLLALDATNGEELWRYEHVLSGASSAKIGIALHGDKVIMPTSDMHMLALDSKTGEIVWDHAFATNTGGVPYSLRAAPLIAGDKVIQGITATFVPAGGMIVALDVNTGEESWRFNTVAQPNEPGGNTWNDLPAMARSGGSVWVPGSYDPELDLVYFGAAPTYDTNALLNRVDKEGVSNDGLFTNTTMAFRPGTGELVWYFQHVKNDQWDLDWIYERHIMTVPFQGRDRKVVMTAGKMALYDALDAATGEYVFSMDMGLQNIIAAVDPTTGDKTMNANATPNPEDTHLLCPFANGGRNWQAASYNPDNKMLFLPIAEICMTGGPTGVGGLLSSGSVMTAAPMEGSDGMFGRLQAVNMETRELDWNFREVVTHASGTLATAGGVVFLGAIDQSFKAFDDRNGEVLWQTDLGDVAASFPITYSVGGKQYLAVVIGQPSLHANIFIGTVTTFLGVENSPVTQLSRDGAALVVFAL